MSSLESLKFSAIPKQVSADPIMMRRAKLIARLVEQKHLLNDPNFVAIEQRWEKSPQGKQLVERKRSVRRWWREDAVGNVYLKLKYGQKQLEIEKGKSAILIENMDDIDGILNLLITATKAGELDQVLATMSKARPIRKK